MAERPDGGPPIVLSPGTFARHEAATQYVEDIVRTRAPRKGIQRSPGYAAFAWAITSEGPVGGSNGMILGQGDVELCYPDPADPTLLVPTGEIVRAYNAGAEVPTNPSGPPIPLFWLNGVWLLGPPAYSGRIARTKSGGISTASGSTLGKGTVVWQRLVRTSAYYYDDSDVEREDTEDEGTVYNLAESAVAGNVEIMVKIVDGIPVVDWEECGEAYS